jgi:hypothetical protein
VLITPIVPVTSLRNPLRLERICVRLGER